MLSKIFNIIYVCQRKFIEERIVCKIRIMLCFNFTETILTNLLLYSAQDLEVMTITSHILDSQRSSLRFIIRYILKRA